MGINIRQKGQCGEREIANVLNPIVNRLLSKHGIPIPGMPVIQRNQNQSAVGGSDLSNTFGLCIEIKRQEALSVNTWWCQCETAASRNGEFPVLLYRQNGKKWRAVVWAWVQLPAGNGASCAMVRAEISFEDFLQWFEKWVDQKLTNGEMPKV